jgi:hypothetical protein
MENNTTLQAIVSSLNARIYKLEEMVNKEVNINYKTRNEILDYIQSKIKLCKNDEHSELLINVLREVKHSIEEIYDNNNYIVDEN